MLIAATVPTEGFTYGPITPLLAYGTATLGSAVGLRCTVRALSLERGERTGWLTLGAIAIGAGVFTMHFVAMVGFSVRDMHIGYDLLTTYGSLGVAMLVAAAGLNLVGQRGPGALTLIGSGLILGLGVAGTHYMGMAGMRMPGEVHYDSRTVWISLTAAVPVVILALWFATWTRRLGATLGAGLLMGTAFTGVHFTAMRAMTVHLQEVSPGAGSTSAVGTLTPIVIGPVLLLLFVALFVTLDPIMERDGRRQWGTRPGEGTGEKLEWTPFDHR